MKKKPVKVSRNESLSDIMRGRKNTAHKMKSEKRQPSKRDRYLQHQ